MEKKLLLYKNLEQQILFSNMVNIIKDYRNNTEEIKTLSANTIYQLIDYTYNKGFEGNLWQMFLVEQLIHHENAFTLSHELNRNSKADTLSLFELHDMEIIKTLFNTDFSMIAKTLDIEAFNWISDFKSENIHLSNADQHIKENISHLVDKINTNAKTTKDFAELIKSFIHQYGIGTYGLHKAFKIIEENNKPKIVPIKNTKEISFNDLVGYELQKQKLIDNTEAFINSKKANNVLLYGDSGTGKSSSIKAILNQYYDKGLRMIEVYKHQFIYLPHIIEQLSKRHYKFIIYMDDLSFEDAEIEFKYLKAIIEGDLEDRPDNILIYATSNRRHLIRESFSDNDDRDLDLHRSDTKEEKLSLSQRFGVTIFYGSPNKQEYQTIVKTLADKYELSIDEETLLLEANSWELHHGGMSGRNAEQFIYYMLSKYQ